VGGRGGKGGRGRWRERWGAMSSSSVADEDIAPPLFPSPYLSDDPPRCTHHPPYTSSSFLSPSLLTWFH